MKTTANLGLKKPEGTDVVNIDDLNYNADIIDTELQKRALKTDVPTIPVQSVNGKTGAVTLSAADVGAATSAQGIKADTALQSSQLGKTGGPAKQDDFVSHLADNTKHLGGLCQSFSGDLNNLYTATGFYMGSNLTNAPTTDWYYIEVFVHRIDSTGWCLQRITNFNDDRYCWTRERRNGTWSSWNCLFQYANDGKTAVANAVTAKGVSASPSDTFSALATKIGQINTGKRTASGTITNTQVSSTTVNGLNFTPNYVVAWYLNADQVNGMYLRALYTHNIKQLAIMGINSNVYYFDTTVTVGGFTISSVGNYILGAWDKERTLYWFASE